MKAHQEEMAHLLPGQRWKRRRRKYFFLIYKYGSVDARAPVLHPTRYFRLSTKRRGRKKRRPNSSELMTAAFSRSVLFFFLFFFFFFSNAQVRHRWLIPNEKRTARKKQCARMCTHLSLLLLLPFLFFFPPMTERPTRGFTCLPLVYFHAISTPIRSSRIPEFPTGVAQQIPTGKWNGGWWWRRRKHQKHWAPEGKVSLKNIRWVV